MSTTESPTDPTLRHDWPRLDSEHYWSPWAAWFPREGIKPATQYRQCVHPICTAYETREAPKA